MQESRNLRNAAGTFQDGFLPPMSLAGGKNKRSQENAERRQEFEDIVSRNLPGFQRVARSWLRNPEDAEDAVQDAMLSAFEHIAHFEGRAQMSTWMMAIVFNAVRMHLRRRARRRVLPLYEPAHDGQLTISDLVADQRPTPEQTFQEYELRRLLVRLTGTLPPSQRVAMQLRQRDDDLSTKEMAEALGVPIGTLKAQLARGRVTLRHRLRWSNSKTRRRTSNQYDIGGQDAGKVKLRRVEASPTQSHPEATSAIHASSCEEIRLRAYEIYLGRGSLPGAMSLTIGKPSTNSTVARRTNASRPIQNNIDHEQPVDTVLERGSHCFFHFADR